MFSRGQHIMSRLLVFTLITISSAAEWNYDDTSEFGPPSWHVNYPRCGGASQSPIDVTEDHVEEIISDPISFRGYDLIPNTSFTLYNNGHGVNLNLPRNTYSIRGGGLPSVYTLEQIHFHWSQVDVLGSEHVVDRRVHPLEIHFVHYDSERFSNVSSALQDPNGLAVVAVNVEVATDYNQTTSLILGHIAESLHKVILNGQEARLNSVSLEELLPTYREFYRYKGSLTTPGCDESVHWTLFTQPLYINAEHLLEFRHIKSSSGEVLQKNFRPVQPINERIIYHYIEPISSASTLTICFYNFTFIILVTVKRLYF